MGVVLIATVLLAAPMMVGTVHPATTVALAGLTVLTLWWLVASRVALPRSELGAVLAVVLLWTALTFSPLPAGLVGVLSPVALPRWDSPLVQIAPSLSYSPGATALEVIKIAGAAAALAAAGALWQRRGCRRPLLVSLVASGVVVAVVSAAQTAMGVERILGVYAPMASSSATFRTPFVNVNHAAQYFELTGLVALGAAARSRRGWRSGFGAASAVLLGAALATGSAGAWIVVPAGVALVALLNLGRHRKWVRWIVPSLAGAGVVVTLILGAGSSDVGKALYTPKLAHVPAVVQLIGDHPLSGVGRGAFRDAFTGYATPGAFLRYTHAESEPLHLVAELGAPVAALLLAAVIATWGFALVRWRRDPAAAGALAGTFAVGLHSLVEFGLEFGGLGLPFVVACGALIRPSRAEPTRAIPQRASVGIAVGLTAALAFAPAAIRHGSWTCELRAIEGANDGVELDEVAQRALRWYPNSADVALITGHGHLVHGRPSEALRFLNRAMVLDPRNPAPHLQAAHALEALGARQQSATEAGIALQLQPDLGQTVHRRLARLVGGPDEALLCLGYDVTLAARYALFLSREFPASARGRDLALRVYDLDPDQPTAARVLAAWEWSAGQRDEALSRLSAARSVRPCDVELVKYESALRRGDGNAAQALAVTREGMDCTGPHVELFFQEVQSLIAMQRHSDAHLSIRNMRDVAFGPHSLALVAAAEGDLAVAEGHPLRAKSHYQESLRLHPERVHVRLELGKVYRELGREREALEQFERVRDESDGFEYLDEWIEQLRAGGSADPDGAR